MRIASLLVRARPEHILELSQTLTRIPGVEVHHTDTAKSLILLTVEDAEGHAVSDTMISVNLAPHVMSASLIYEHTDHSTPSTPSIS